MTIIGIDNNERKFKVQRSAVILGQHAHVDSIDLPEDLFEKGDYPQIFDKGLADYIAAYGPLPNEPVTLVMPDVLFTLDTIVLPTMSRRNMGETFRTEYQNLYKNHDQLVSHAVIISTNKKTTQYLLTLIRKELLQRFREILAGRSLKLDKVVSAAAARCETLTEQHARLHRDTYLFLDVQDHSSSLVLYDKGRLFGFASLPFGMDALPDDRMVNEYDLYDHDVADLAVINAQERAKAKKLTTAAEEENLNADVVLDNPDGSPTISKQDIMAMAQQMQEEEAAATAALAPVDADDDDLEEETAPVEVQTTPQGKRYIKKTRRLPAFMQRPVPETPNGMVCENFRAFQVRLLNYARTCKINDTLPTPAYIVLNLPKQYEFLTQMLNAQEDNGIPFRLLCTDGHSGILKDLEMHGASKMTARSRNPVF